MKPSEATRNSSMQVMMARRVRTTTGDASCRNLAFVAMMPLDGTRASTSCAAAARAFGDIGGDLAVDAVVAAGGAHELVPGGRPGADRDRGAVRRVPALAAVTPDLRADFLAPADPNLWRLLHVCADAARQLGQGTFSSRS